MHTLIRRLRRRGIDDSGFTLMELVVTVAVMGIIVVTLAGVVLSYLRNMVDTQARLSESHDVQLASAYWQRDVASIGLRSATQDPTTGEFPLVQSVNVSPCTVPAGATPEVTLAWSEYTSKVSTDPADEVKVTYASRPNGTVFELIRVRCGSEPSEVQVASTLESRPLVKCDGAASNCNLVAVPDIITIDLVVLDDSGNNDSAYRATLSGERRQT